MRGKPSSGISGSDVRSSAELLSPIPSKHAPPSTPLTFTVHDSRTGPTWLTVHQVTRGGGLLFTTVGEARVKGLKTLCSLPFLLASLRQPPEGRGAAHLALAPAGCSQAKGSLCGEATCNMQCQSQTRITKGGAVLIYVTEKAEMDLASST